MLIGTSPLLVDDLTPSILSRKRKQGANQKNGNTKDFIQLSNCKEKTPDLDLFRHIKAKMQKIASQKTITSLWYSYCAAKSLTYKYNQGDIVDNSYYLGISTREALILQQLQMLQKCIKKACLVKQFAIALKRFYIAKVVSLYKEATAQKKCTSCASQGSLVDQFASILFLDVI
jgi:hypothetical protein